MALSVKKLFFSAAVIFSEKTTKNHVSDHRPPFQAQLALLYDAENVKPQAKQ